MATMTAPSSDTETSLPRRYDSLEDRLAYNEMSMGNNGAVMNREEKVTLRERYGYCVECEDAPVKIYNIKRSRMNPLWVTKEPRAVAGECAGGICFVCHPDKDPSRKSRRSRGSRGSQRHLAPNSPGELDPSSAVRFRSYIPENVTQQSPTISGVRPRLRAPLPFAPNDLSSDSQPHPVNPIRRSVDAYSRSRYQNSPSRLSRRLISDDGHGGRSVRAPFPQIFVPEPMRTHNPEVKTPSVGSDSTDNGSQLRETALYRHRRQESESSHETPSQTVISSRGSRDDSDHIFDNESIKPPSRTRERRGHEQDETTKSKTKSNSEAVESSWLDKVPQSKDLGNQMREASVPSLVSSSATMVSNLSMSIASGTSSRDSSLPINSAQQDAVGGGQNNVPSPPPPLLEPRRPVSDTGVFKETGSISTPSPPPPLSESRRLCMEKDVLDKEMGIASIPSLLPPVPGTGQLNMERGVLDKEMGSLPTPSPPPLLSEPRSGTETGVSDKEIGNFHTPSPPPPVSETRLPGISDKEIRSILEGLDSLIRDLASNGGSEFLAEVVLGAIREHSNTPDVLGHCLKLLWDLCKDNESHKEAIIASGGADDIIRALKAFPQNAILQEKGCGAIWSLGVTANNRVVLVRAGACVQVVQALRDFIATETLVRIAIGGMRTLSPEWEARDAFSRLNASKLTREAMVIHRSCAAVQRDGCALLSNCAVDIEKQFVAVVPQEELDAIVQAMRHHRHEVSVMHGACFALKNYTYEEKNCRTLRQCEGVDEILDYAAAFEASPACQNDAADIVYRLQVSRTLDESLEDPNYKSLVHIVDLQAETPQALRSILDFMRNNDWSPKLIADGLQMFLRIINETDSSSKMCQRNRIYENGHLKQIFKYCKSFDNNEKVSEEACALIACLASEESRIPELYKEGACNLVFKSLEFRGNEQLITHALQALKLMSTNVDCFTQIKAKMSLVTEAMAEHPGSDIIQMNGIAVVSSLDYFEAHR